MKKLKPTNKPKAKILVEPPVGLPQAQPMPFHEFVRRILRVRPQEIKLPKH